MHYKIRQEIAVGILFFVAIIILGYYTILMTKKFVDREKTYPINIAFEDVAGLKEGNRVVVNGVPAGIVDEIKLIDNYVYVKISIYNKFIFYENYSIRVQNESLMGTKMVSIYPGVKLDREGVEYSEISAQEKLSGELDDPIVSVTEMIEENRENIYATIKNIREVTEKINSGRGTIGKLINDDKVIAQTDTLLKEFREVLEDAREQAPVNSFIRAALSAF